MDLIVTAVVPDTCSSAQAPADSEAREPEPAVDALGDDEEEEQVSLLPLTCQ